MEPIDDADKRQAETEAEIAARFDGLITPIVAIRCFGSGSGRDHRRCFRHINFSPEEPGTIVTQTQTSTSARRRGWSQRQRHGQRVWLCPDCL